MESGVLLVNFRFRGPNHDPVPWPYFRLKYIIFRYKASNSKPYSDLVSAIHTRFCKIRIHFQTFTPKKSTSYFSPKWLKNDTLQLEPHKPPDSLYRGSSPAHPTHGLSNVVPNIVAIGGQRTSQCRNQINSCFVALRGT